MDPLRTVPRMDPVVREALALRAVEIHAGEIARQGFDAERSGNFEAAMKKYEEAFAIDPRDPFPLYRRGRVLFTLLDLEGALKEHEASARVAEDLAREAAGLVPRSRAVMTGGGGGACQGLDDAPPRAWLLPDPDLRSWNYVRIGQIEDLRGRRRAALRAYRRALALPDLRGAHEEAAKGVRSPFTRPER
jgi:tetratricopeptide (TPR) repeat protein